MTDLYTKAQQVANEILSGRLLDQVQAFQVNPARRELFAAQGTRLQGHLWRSSPEVLLAEEVAPGDLFERLSELVGTLRTLHRLGVFTDLRDPPTGQARTPLRPAALEHIAAVAAQMEEVLAVADATVVMEAPVVAATMPPATQDARGATAEAAAVDPRAAHARAVGVLGELLAIAKTDAWSLGSDRLDKALAAAREIVQDAGPQYVIFSQQEFDASGDGAGFWSNEDGWTEREQASAFCAAELPFLQLPVSTDARWISLAEAHGDVLIMGGGAKP